MLFLACCSISTHLALSQVTMMADDALAVAYPKERRDLEFSGARFSPDGAFLALTLKGITIGDPEQVWLYEVRSRRLTAVTERPRQSVAIRDMAWSDDGTLYVKAERIAGGERIFFLAATNAQVKEIDQPPAPIAGLFDRRANLECCEERNDSFVVKAANQGHGFFLLSMRLSHGTAWETIARGSWELETFLFDPNRSRVRYPARDAIVTFDLKTRKLHSLSLESGIGLGLLAQTRDATVIAYTVAGSCLAKPQPPNQLATGQPRHLCFVKTE